MTIHTHTSTHTHTHTHTTVVTCTDNGGPAATVPTALDPTHPDYWTALKQNGWGFNDTSNDVFAKYGSKKQSGAAGGAKRGEDGEYLGADAEASHAFHAQCCICARVCGCVCVCEYHIVLRWNLRMCVYACGMGWWEDDGLCRQYPMPMVVKEMG
jgi:hypothetical protein